MKAVNEVEVVGEEKKKNAEGRIVRSIWMPPMLDNLVNMLVEVGLYANYSEVVRHALFRLIEDVYPIFDSSKDIYYLIEDEETGKVVFSEGRELSFAIVPWSQKKGAVIDALRYLARPVGGREQAILIPMKRLWRTIEERSGLKVRTVPEKVCVSIAVRMLSGKYFTKGNYYITIEGIVAIHNKHRGSRRIVVLKAIPIDEK